MRVTALALMTLENLPNIVRFCGELEDFASASAPLFFSFFLLFLPSIAINLAWHRPSVADIRKSLLTCRLCVCVSLCHRNAAGGGGKKHWLSFLSSLVGGKKKKETISIESFAFEPEKCCGRTLSEGVL